MDFHRLPKIDLHLHIDGSVRTQTIFDLAQKAGVKLPATDVAGLTHFVRVSPDCRSLTEFLATFEVFYPLLQSPSAIERITRELCQDLGKDNVIYAELRFAPILNISDLSHSFENMKAVVEAAVRGLEEGTASAGIDAGLLLCCYRGFDPRYAVETVRIAHEHREEAARAGRNPVVVGVDLAGDESRYPASDFREAFALARQFGIPATVHAAEAAGPQSARDALDILGAQRIGHGIHIEDDPSLLERIIREKIPLEICLTSNLQTATVASLEAHPFRRYLDRGVRVTINTDDPAISDITLSGEWQTAALAYKLSEAEIYKILTNSLEASFAPLDVRKRVESRLSASVKTA